MDTLRCESRTCIDRSRKGQKSVLKPDQQALQKGNMPEIKCIDRTCERCGKEFKTRKSYARMGWGRYCCLDCMRKASSHIGGKASQAAHPQKSAKNHDLQKTAYGKMRAKAYSDIKPCEICGNPEVIRHHDDYSNPFDFRFLCHKHHIQLHKDLS
jgi:hypothetical protein